MKYINLNRKLFAVCFVLLTGACKPGQRDTDGTRAPFAGTWTIVKAVRNLDDITAGGDFGRSLITLNKDGTYTVEKSALFMVTTDGNWDVRKDPGGDIIVLRPAGGATAAGYEMRSDTTGDGRNVIVSFSTGSANTYQYLLKKIAPQEKAKS